MRIWVARAEPGASATAGGLRVLGHEPLTAPLLSLRSTAHEPIDLTGVGALAFTSANAVWAFAAVAPNRTRPVFAVGDATAAAARSAGFSRVRSAAGDVTDLARLLASERASFEGVVLHPRAAEPAGDLAGALAEAGVTLRPLVLYETLAAERLPPPVAQALEADALDAVLVHSPKTARCLAHLLPHPPARLAAFALSEACAAPLRAAGFQRVEVAAHPNEDALFALVEAAGERRRLMGPWFWTALAFGLACVLAGAGVAYFGSRLLAPD